MFTITDGLIFVGLFVATFLSDAAYAYYTVAVVEKRATMAANMTFIIHLITICSVFSYTKDSKHAIPILLGAWCGCWFIVKKTAKK